MNVSDDYRRGAADAFAFIMRAIQETLGPPHDDPAEPSPEFLRAEEGLLDIVRDVAEGRLALFDPADLSDIPGLADEARARANEVLERQRYLARAILASREGNEVPG